MTRSVLWDSSAILALLDADDADHARAVAVARDIASELRPIFITNSIEAETHPGEIVVPMRPDGARPLRNCIR